MTRPKDPGPCDACGADATRRTEFTAATDCTKVTVTIQRCLEASRRFVYGSKP